MVEQQLVTEKYYICPQCEDLSTFSEQLDACSNGGMPYCYCEFDNGRIFIGYRRISKSLWETLNNLKNKKSRLKLYFHSVKVKLNKT